MSPLRQRISSYRSKAAWLVADVVRHLRWRLAGLVFYSVLVILARIVAFGGLLAYVRGLASGKPLVLPYVHIALPADHFALWASVIFLAGIAMGIFGLLEARLRTALASDYAVQALDRVLRVLSTSHLASGGLGSRPMPYFLRLVGGDSWALLRAILPLLSIVLPIIQFLAACAILITLSWQIALALLVAGALYLVPYYLLSHRMVLASSARETNTSAFKAAARATLATISYPQFRGPVGSQSIDSLTRGSILQERIRLYRLLRTNRNAIQCLNSVFMAVFMVVLLFFVDKSNAMTAMVHMLTYVIVLIHAYSAANVMTTLAASFNRFFPQFSRFVEVLKKHDRAAPTPTGSGAKAAVALRCQAPASQHLPGTLPDLTLHGGERCLVIQAAPLGAKTLASWLTRIGGFKVFRHAIPVIVPPPGELPDLPLVDLASGHGGASTDECRPALENLISSLGLSDDLGRLPDGLDTPWSVARRKASPALRLTVATAPALLAAPKAIAIVDARMLANIDISQADRILACNPGVIWLIAVQDMASAKATARALYQWAVVASSEGIIGMGNAQWLARATEAVEAQAMPRGEDFDAANEDDEDDEF